MHKMCNSVLGDLRLEEARSDRMLLTKGCWSRLSIISQCPRTPRPAYLADVRWQLYAKLEPYARLTGTSTLDAPKKHLFLGNGCEVLCMFSTPSTDHAASEASLLETQTLC